MLYGYCPDPVRFQRFLLVEKRDFEVMQYYVARCSARSAWVACRQSKDYVALTLCLIFWEQRCAIILPLSDIYIHLRYSKVKS